MQKRIFTYWVTPDGKEVPGYIKLCLQTWFEHIPDLELVILNHENLHQWVGDVIDYYRFFRLSYAMQSDIARILTLANHGGIYIDADTIITQDIFEKTPALDSKKLTAFGYPGTSSVHMAVLISSNPDNKFIKSAANATLNRLQNIPLEGDLNIKWDHFANGIIADVKQEYVANYLNILPREETGNILEAGYFTDLSTQGQYLKFYFFNHPESFVKEAIEKIKFGAVSLHNSWTPAFYKEYTPEQVIESDLMLSQVLKYALGNFLSN